MSGIIKSLLICNLNNYVISLQPLGGGGSTLIESLMTDRKAIHIDLNPLSVFITKSLVTPIDFDEMNIEFEKVKKQFLKNAPHTKVEI